MYAHLGSPCVGHITDRCPVTHGPVLQMDVGGAVLRGAVTELWQVTVGHRVTTQRGGGLGLTGAEVTTSAGATLSLGVQLACAGIAASVCTVLDIETMKINNVYI